MPPEALPADPWRPRVLLVDDDPLVLALAQRALAEAAFDVATASRGDAALRRLRVFDPHLVILDCGLASVTELELMNEIRRRDARVTIVVLSARRGPIHERVMSSYGADRILTKPISSKRLVDEIRSLAPKGPSDVA